MSESLSSLNGKRNTRKNRKASPAVVAATVCMRIQRSGIIDRGEAAG
jgi:hypothetical protein